MPCTHISMVVHKVIYPKYSKHWPYTVAQTINWLCMKCQIMVKSWVIFFTFQVIWMKIHSKLNKFRIKKLDCYIVSDLRFLLEIQAILPKTSPFLSAQMAVLSSFFHMYLGCINLVVHRVGAIISAKCHLLCYPQSQISPTTILSLSVLYGWTDFGVSKYIQGPTWAISTNRFFSTLHVSGGITKVPLINVNLT